MNIKPLQGIKVLDLSAGVAGPHAGMLLAMNGADVIKIEPPEGDWSRRLGTHENGQSTYSLYYNQGKRSLCLDLKAPQAKAILKKLIEQADIFIESFRPGVIDRLGLSYQDVAAIKPNMVYLSVSGFGQAGELAKLPGTDSAIQAYTGLMYLNRDADGTPQRFPHIIVDVVAGLYAYEMISSAYIKALRFNQGSYLDCSLLHVSLSMQAPVLMRHQTEKGLESQDPVPVGVFQTSDGYLSISVSREDQFERLCRCMGREDLREMPEFATNAQRIENKEALLEILQGEFMKASNEIWDQRLEQADIVHGLVKDYDSLLASSALRDMKVMAEARLSTTNPPLVFPETLTANWPESTAQLAPGVGEHTTEILAQAGIPDAEIRELLTSRAVQQG